MLRFSLFLSLVLMLSACSAGSDESDELDGTSSLETQTEETSLVEESEDIQAFFARLKSTIRANDAEAVANMAMFPLESGMTREEFLSTHYQTSLGEGEFRDRLLAGSPGALNEEADGRYSFTALVSDCGEEMQEFDCESAIVYYFAQNAEGHWRIADMMFAG